MRKIIMIGTLVLAVNNLLAQTNRNFAWYDKYTYEAYQNKEWNEVISVGKEAIKDGVDFFYLRMRIGIAYYEQAKYRSAIACFKKALEFNANDPLTLEYLYYSYKFSGRIFDAGLVYARHKSQLTSRKVKNPSGIITGFYTEAGLRFPGLVLQDYGPIKYVHAGLEQQLGSKLNLYHGYSRLSQNIFENETVTRMGRSYTVSTKRKYIQNEYYLRATVPLVNGLQLIGGMHLQSINDTIQYNNQMFLGGISASFKPFDLYASYGNSKVNSVEHNQVTAGVILYPSMNMNVYLQTSFTHHTSEGISNTIFYEKIGLRTGKNTWFEFHGTFGNLKNVQELDGFYFYNLTDDLRSRIGITSIFLLGNKAKLFAGYSVENMTEAETLIEYKQHYLFAGLQIQLKN